MSPTEDNLNLYNEYNKTLRAWLVGFGFGVPALFIVNEPAQEKLIHASSFHCIIWLFLAGAAAQIFMALLNKTISWCAYYNHSHPTKAVKLVKCLAAMENWFFIDVILDIISLISFGWSILLIVGLY